MTVINTMLLANNTRPGSVLEGKLTGLEPLDLSQPVDLSSLLSAADFSRLFFGQFQAQQASTGNGTTAAQNLPGSLAAGGKALPGLPLWPVAMEGIGEQLTPLFSPELLEESSLPGSGDPVGDHLSGVTHPLLAAALMQQLSISETGQVFRPGQGTESWQPSPGLNLASERALSRSPALRAALEQMLAQAKPGEGEALLSQLQSGTDADRQGALRSTDFSSLLSGDRGSSLAGPAMGQGGESLLQAMRQMPLIPGQQAGTPFVRLSIDTPMHQPQWGEALAGRIVWMLTESNHTAQINLNPPELGPIEVRVSMKDDHTNVNFYAHHGDVRDAIEEAMPRLREMLQQNGLKLDESQISHQSFSQSQHQDHEAGAKQHLHSDSDADSSIATRGESSATRVSHNVTIGYIDQYV